MRRLAVLALLLGLAAGARAQEPQRFLSTHGTFTLDRLYKKGVLSRQEEGRAFLYAPLKSREDLEQMLTTETLHAILQSFDIGGSIRPILSSFVEAVSRFFEALLPQSLDVVAVGLEELVQVGKLWLSRVVQLGCSCPTGSPSCTRNSWWLVSHPWVRSPCGHARR